jgi:hypothetical protein
MARQHKWVDLCLSAMQRREAALVVVDCQRDTMTHSTYTDRDDYYYLSRQFGNIIVFPDRPLFDQSGHQSQGILGNVGRIY